MCFLCLALLWGVDTYAPAVAPLNYPALAIGLVLTYQLFVGSRTLGLLLSLLLTGASGFLLLALVTDAAHRTSFDARSLRFVGIGSLLVSTNLTMAGVLFRAYKKTFPPPTLRNSGT